MLYFQGTLIQVFFCLHAAFLSPDAAKCFFKKIGTKYASVSEAEFKPGFKQVQEASDGTDPLRTTLFFSPYWEQFTLIAIVSCSVSTATNAVLRVSHVHSEHGRCGRHRCR